MKVCKLLWDVFQLKLNEKKNKAAMELLQEKKLRTMLRYAYQHSPYYHQAFEAAGIREDTIDLVPLAQFPTLDKATLLERFDELITVGDVTQEEIWRFDRENQGRAPLKGKYHVVHSSGSTGKPKYFLYDNRAWHTMLTGILRGALWGMTMPQILRLLLKGPRIAYLAATDGRYGGAMAVGDGIDGVGARQIHLDIKAPLSQWVKELRIFRPNLIIGYPSALKILGELVERGEVVLEVQRVISCGEPLGASLRRYLESVFQAQVVNIYGASESLALGVELEPARGMVLFDDMNRLEMVDGKLYLTSLYNFAQPLIRYCLSDQFLLQAPKAGEQPAFSVALGLLGRKEDLLWFEDARGKRDFLHPLAIEGFCLEGLVDYQFRQIGKDAFEMLVELSPTGNPEEIRRQMLGKMKEILEEKQLHYVQFYVVVGEAIAPDPVTGKKRLIVSRDEEERAAG